VEFDLLCVPLGLQRPVVSQDVVDHGQDVAGTFGIVVRVVLDSLEYNYNRLVECFFTLEPILPNKLSLVKLLNFKKDFISLKLFFCQLRHY
jgi:hypothetical protein